MNKYQEALEYITPRLKDYRTVKEDKFELHYNNKASKDYNAIQSIKELVDKATPMKPTITNGKPYCSVCGYSTMIDGFEVSHCFACGQKIDWSNEE